MKKKQRIFISLLAVVVLVLAAAVTFVVIQTKNANTDPYQAKPAAPDLSTPEAAVKSYLAWISYAYAIGDSNVSTPTMTPYEGVRIDSYVQLYKERGQTLEQRLVKFAVTSSKISGKTATVKTKETWEYRYLLSSQPPDQQKPALHQTVYVVTYHLKKSDSRWQVDSVDATAKTKVQ